VRLECRHEEGFLAAVAEAGEVRDIDPERVEQAEQVPSVVQVVGRVVVPGLGLGAP
jgi:hypothetical protein